MFHLIFHGIGDVSGFEELWLGIFWNMNLSFNSPDGSKTCIEKLRVFLNQCFDLLVVTTNGIDGWLVKADML